MFQLATDAATRPSLPALRTATRPSPQRWSWDFLRTWFGPEIAVTLTAGLIFIWRVGAASPWRDEAATMVIARRTVPQILDLARTVDFVHLAYYLLVHALMQVHPTATLDAAVAPVRIISVVAAALAAGVMVRIGRQLDSLPVGVMAGLAYAACPFVSRFAQEARSYALVSLVAVFSTYALLRACRRPWLRRRWVLYAVTLVLLCVLNLLSLLLLSVHTIHVLSSTSGAIRRRWLAAVTVAGVLAAPFVAVAYHQRAQVDWLGRPDLTNLRDFLSVEYHTLAVPLLAILAGLAATRLPIGSAPHRAAFRLGLSWGLVPPVLLWLISQVDPLFDWRYVVFTLPGTALLIASLTPFVRPYGIAIAMVAVVVGGWPMQVMYRDPALGHSEDVRGATRYIQQHAKAGDAVLFVPWYMRILEQMYPQRFQSLDDVAIAQDPVSSATIFGVEKPADEIVAALKGHNRVWLITGLQGMAETSGNGDTQKVAQLLGDYRIVRHQTVARFQVFLYVRTPSSPTPPDPVPHVALSGPIPF